MSAKPRKKPPLRNWRILHKGTDQDSLEQAFLYHLEYSLGEDQYTANRHDVFMSLSRVVRDLIVERWIGTQQTYHRVNAKRVYYLSMEYLVGRLMGNALVALGIRDRIGELLDKFGFKIDDVLDEEREAALGNGGLGRLAACFLDSMATLQLPSVGYGIRYEYGLFRQRISNGFQVEEPDNWLSAGDHWEIPRPKLTFPIQFYGKTVTRGKRTTWEDTQNVLVMPYDILIPAFRNPTVNTLRLWSVRASGEFDLQYFNDGDYSKAWERIVVSENISKVLYPRDDKIEGKELRLKQEYFFTAASIRDILRRHLWQGNTLENLSQKVAIHLNETHPSLGIPEMLRILVDENGMPWEKAWDQTRKVFSYTNHTLMGEALETWPVSLMERLLPRHLELIYLINDRFLKRIRRSYPNDLPRVQRMSMVEEEYGKQIRMANLAVVGSYSTNGVARLHSDLIKRDLFKDFFDVYPGRFNNKTNGISQRLWLMKANRKLASLITDRIGDRWTRDLYALRDLEGIASDDDFRQQWQEAKTDNKKRLAEIVKERLNERIDPESIFDCQVKRFHEYKRQHLNILHIISLYNRLRRDPGMELPPRTFVFSGKAAPGYFLAKQIIKLIHGVAERVNNDKKIDGRLKVVFIPNYNVTQAELIIPAADISEQISTAGTEASGTGNMKFCLNGAVIVGTMDGANIEIREQVGPENVFIFGMTTNEVRKLRKKGYVPMDFCKRNPLLKEAVDQIRKGFFTRKEKGVLDAFVGALTKHDHYLSLADFDSYCRCQKEAGEAYQNRDGWLKKSIMNTAHMGKFSCDRTIRDYAQEIWKLKPVVPDEPKT